MKISKGMYCYDKSNRKVGIGKIVEFWKNNNVLIEYKNNINSVSKGNVVASFNIIDLIEVGDYVNDAFVLDFETLQTGEKAVIVDGLITYGWGQGVIPASEIKEVVTKEQFNSMKYVVERDTNESL